MSKWTDNVLRILNAVGFSVLVLVNVGFLLAECPKQINCVSMSILSCTEEPNDNGVCPGRHEDVYKNGFGGSDSDTYTCDDSEETSHCTFNCPCVPFYSKYGSPVGCKPDHNDNSCQLTRAYIKEQVSRGG